MNFDLSLPMADGNVKEMKQEREMHCLKQEPCFLAGFWRLPLSELDEHNTQ
jgi:hypothetical protein